MVISAEARKVHETPQYGETLAHLFTRRRISAGTFDMVGRAHIHYVVPRGQHFHAGARSRAKHQTFIKFEKTTADNHAPVFSFSPTFRTMAEKQRVIWQAPFR